MDEAETGSGSRAECRGGVLVKDGRPKEQAGVVELSCGSSSKGAAGFPSESTERGPGAEVTDGEDCLGIRSQGAGKVARLGGLESGPAAYDFGPNWEAQFSSGLGEASLKPASEGAQKYGPNCESRPIMI